MAGSVTLTGLVALKKTLARLDKKLIANQKRGILLSAHQVRTEAIKLISKGARSGVKYTRYLPYRTGIASAAGEPPKSDTGRLVSQIFVDIDADGFGATVGTNLDYGLYLEVGTSKMSARPWLTPTLETLQPKLVKQFKKDLQEIIDAHGRRT